MLGLLLRVAVGVIAAAAVTYTIYKVVNKKAVKEEVNKQLEKSNLLGEAIAAKITKIDKNNGVLSLDALDDFDDPIKEDIEVHGEAISNDLRKGQVIKLTDY